MSDTKTATQATNGNTKIQLKNYREAVGASRRVFETQYPEKAREKFQQESGFAIMHCEKNTYLQKCDLDSLRNAVINVALTGLSLNPVTKLAYIVPRKENGKLVAVLEPSYMGMIEVLRNSGAVKSITGAVVYEGDAFEYAQGTKPFLDHTPVMNREAGVKPIAAYAVALMPDGTREFFVMDWNGIEKRRNNSESWKNETARKFSPWKKWPEEMAIKTVIRAFYKFLPKTEKANEVLRVFDEGNPVDLNTGEVIQAEVVDNPDF